MLEVLRERLNREKQEFTKVFSVLEATKQEIEDLAKKTGDETGNLQK